MHCSKTNTLTINHFPLRKCKPSNMMFFFICISSFFQILLLWIENSKIDFLSLQVNTPKFVWSIYYISRRRLVRRTKLDAVEDDGLMLDGMIPVGIFVFWVSFSFLLKTHTEYSYNTLITMVYRLYIDMHCYSQRESSLSLSKNKHIKYLDS